MFLDSSVKEKYDEMEDKKQRSSSAINKAQLSEELILSIIMNSSMDTIYFKDTDSRFLINSKAHAMQFGYDDPKEIFGKSDFDFSPEEFAQSTFADEKRIMETGIPSIGTIEKWVKKDGSVVWFSSSKYPLYDLEGKTIGTWGTSRDITQLKIAEEELARVNIELAQANAKLKRLSDIDRLSGLYNHRRFHESIESTNGRYVKEKEEGLNNTFCVVILDIDCFKAVNDTYGHLFGDMAIKHIADIITSNTRLTDSCFRYGGDEFAIILLNTDITTGIELSERLCEIIEASPFVANEVAITLTASIGIAAFNGDSNYYNLLQEADNNLYKSKRRGKNQVN